jgi:hypothetical protein
VIAPLPFIVTAHSFLLAQALEAAIVQQILGIDFAGNHTKWSQGCRYSNVWIANALSNGQLIEIVNLQRVQELPGSGTPFARLCNLLSQWSGTVAIDAPFSIPSGYVTDIEALWNRIASLPLHDRPFPRGDALLRTVDPSLGQRGRKIYRETEKQWLTRGVNTRSTLWNGPRGGAPFAVACMTVLGRHGGDVWPMRMRSSDSGCALVEAFPAAQLRHWRLPNNKYDGPSEGAQEVRKTILGQLRDIHGLVISADFGAFCEASADALDAVICAYAAAAVAWDRIGVGQLDKADIEGWIAVHE